MFDAAVESIDIPQEELDFEKTSFGLHKFKKAKEFSDIQINYFDYAQSKFGSTPITHFFQEWMNNIFDTKKRVVKSRWRYHSKNLSVTLTRYYKDTKTGKPKEVTSTSYYLAKCFPLSINSIDLDQNGDRLSYSVTLSCERIQPFFNSFL